MAVGLSPSHRGFQSGPPHRAVANGRIASLPHIYALLTPPFRVYMNYISLQNEAFAIDEKTSSAERPLDRLGWCWVGSVGGPAAMTAPVVWRVTSHSFGSFFAYSSGSVFANVMRVVWLLVEPAK